MTMPKRTGKWSSAKGKGAAITFLRSLIGHDGDGCVIWPMCREPTNGDGMMGYNGDHFWAHRLMCEMAHGESPSSAHEAAHSCGRGHDGCVNPNHLCWKTRTANQLDRRRHGTKAPPGGYRWNPKLTPEKVMEIRRLKGTKTQLELARDFGVTDATIRDVTSGKSWKHLPLA